MPACRYRQMPLLVNRWGLSTSSVRSAHATPARVLPEEAGCRSRERNCPLRPGTDWQICQEQAIFHFLRATSRNENDAKTRWPSWNSRQCVIRVWVATPALAHECLLQGRTGFQSLHLMRMRRDFPLLGDASVPRLALWNVNLSHEAEGKTPSESSEPNHLKVPSGQNRSAR